MAAASAGTHKINAGPVAIPGSAVVMSRGHLVQQQQVVMQQHSQQHQQQQLHQHQHVQHHSSNAAHQHQQQQQPAVLLQHHQQQNVHFQMQHQSHSMVGQSVSGPNHHSQQPHSGVHHASPSQPHQQHPQQQQHQQRQQSFVPRIGQNPNGMQIIANNVIARQQLHQNQFPHHQHQQQHQTQIQQNYTHSQLLSHQRQQQQQSQVHPSSELTEASTGGKVQHQQPLKIPPPPTIASRHALASKQQTSARGTTPPSVSVGTPSANLAPGWLRINANNEIIYISPTGANLRSQVQIQDYLLSPGTCKCGLPCPLRPEFFFDFNSQVPNIPLKVPPENGLPTRSLACLHQRRFLESSHHQQQQQQHQEHQQIDQLQHQSQQQQQLLHGQNHSQQQSPHHQQQVAHHQQQPQHQQQEHLEQQKQQQQQQHEQSGLKDAKRRKFTLPTTNPNKILSATQQNTSPTIYATSSSPVQGTSQMVSMDKTQQHIESLSGKTTPVDMQKVQIATTNVPTPNQTISSDKPERQIGGVTLSKTPPWRKSQTATSGYSSENNERVPPLPPAHLEPSKGLSTAPPWQGATQPGYVPRFYTKNRLLTGITKKFPNFKDDPTGYLSQQTALLHNSMLNVVQAPKDMDGEEVDEIRETSTSKTVIHHQQQQQQQHQHQQQQPQPHPQPQQAHHQQAENSMFSVDAKHPHYSNTSTSSQAQQHPQQQQQQPHPELVQSSNSNFLSQYQPPQQQPSTQQVPATIPSVTSTGNRHMIVPSSQQQQYHEQAEATKADAATEKRRIYPTPGQQQQQQEPLAQVQQQAQSQTHLTTSIGGQTVTQFPNGMVQIKQTCDRIAPQIIQTPMKPQQQLQLQQQIQQHNILFRQNQQIQKQTNNSNKQPKPTITVPAAQESPVSSSTTFPNRSTPETSQQHQQILSDNSKGPAQVGAISTSHESPRPCPPSPAESTESTSSRASIKTAPSPSLIQNPHVVTSKKVESQKVLRQQKASQQSLYMQTASRNTITSVTAGKTPTATTTSSTTNIESQNKIQHHSQKLSPNSNIPITNLQLQPVLRDSSNSQIIMTSTGQLIVMPSTSSIKTQQQLSGNHHMIISSGNSDNNATIHQNVDVQQQILNGTSANASNSNGSIIIQNAGGSNNFQIQGSNIQPTTVILNNGQNLLGTGTKVLTNGGNILNNISGNIISPNNTGMLGQQTVVLNTLPNGYVIQPNFATVDGQVVSQIVNQENGATTYVQQPQSQQQHTQRIIITSPDIKRKAKKRKNSSSSSPSTTPSSLSPQQSPTIQQQAATVLQNHQNNGQAQVVQISTGPQYPTQGFQISPGIQGIVVNKNAQSPAPQQQILFQNGQIIQPINMLGQQLLVPAGLVMATPDTTLLQIQNVGTACGSILTPQGMMLRAASPQNKNFLSPSGGGQQFIVGNNGQLSPIGQIYSTPMGIMMPSQGNGGTTTYVQQNATIVQHQHQQQQQQPAHQQQQQQHQQHQAQAIQQQSQVVQHQSVSIQQQQQLHHQQHVQQQQPQHSNNQTITVINKRLLDEVANVQRTAAASPPDTTTHSPRSPERPPSQRSGGSDMVQCVSSSEPDGVVSPQSVDSAQSPTTTDCDRGVSYQTTNVYKPSDAKMRRVKSPAQHTYGSSTQDIMKPDSHESPTNSPPASSSMPAISSTIHKTNSTASNRTIKSVSTVAVPSDFIHNGVHKSFAIGELIWGAARGHPAWPGKIVNPPDGISTPRDYQNESIWVQWFGGGGRSHAELVAVNTLKSLSEGLEAHHKAQKDTRKSRKLNSQLERAIQEAMTELDRISAAPSGNNCSQPTSTSPSSIQTANSGSAKNRGRGRTTISQSLTQQRSKPIRIAPAPPNATTIINPANSTSLNGTKQQATTSINQVSSQQHQLHQHHQSQTQTK